MRPSTLSPCWLRHRTVALVVGCIVMSVAHLGMAQVQPSFSQLTQFAVSVGTDTSTIGVQAFTLANVNPGHDSFLDLIVVDQDNDKVHVFLGKGDGTFTGPVDHDAPSTPTAVVVADVSSPFASPNAGAPDGNPDIIVGSDAGDVWILFGQGDGTFPNSEDISDAASASEVDGFAVGDFNGDHFLDIAVGDNDTVEFLCYQDGGFASCPTGMVDTGSSGMVDIVAGDFDGDGKLDVATLNQDTVDVTPIYGDGSGNFTAASLISVKGESDSVPVDLAVGFLDSGNTIADLVTLSNGNIGEFYIVDLIGHANRNLQSQNVITSTASSSLALADFNGDGLPDAIVANADNGADTTSNVGTGSGLDDSSFVLSKPALPAAIGIAPGDIGGDNLPDLVLLLADGEHMLAVINVTNTAPITGTPGGSQTPTAGTPAPVGTPTPPAPTATATATATPTPMPTANYGRCELQAVSNGQLAGIATGDFNGDGTPDIAVTDAVNNAVYIISNTSGLEAQLMSCAMSQSTTPVLLSPTSIPVGTLPGAIVASDIDRDGDVDLVVAESDGIVILRNNGGVFTPEPAIQVGRNPAAIVADYPVDPQDPSIRRALDVNGDGFPDLVVANQGDAFLSVLTGCAAGQGTCPANGFMPAAPVGIFAAASTVTAADFNQDGKVDLVAGAGTSAIFVLNGASGLTASTTFAPGSKIVSVTSGYFDSDRVPDVLIASTSGANVFLFHNGGFAQSGSFSPGDPPGIPTPGPGTPSPAGTPTPGPIAAGVGLFNAIDMSTDAVVANFRDSALYFGMGDGAGAFKSPPILPFAVGGAPVALAVANIDGDGMVDVVTANHDGTITVLLSSVPPPTPTPLPTSTPTITGTLTPTPTPTPTGPSGTATITETPSASPTPVDTATPKLGAFSISSCSIDDGAGHTSPGAVVILALLVLARGLRRRQMRAVLGLFMVATLGWLGSASAQTATLPNYLTCVVPSASLGNTGSIPAGAVGHFDDSLSLDLALLDPAHNQFAVELTNTPLFQIGSCAQAVTPITNSVQGPRAIAAGLISSDNLSDLAIALQSTVQVFSSAGSGTFTNGGTTAQLSKIPTTVAVDDLDGDNNADLVVGDQGGNVSILFGPPNGSGIYAVSTALSIAADEVVAVRIADFDGNGLRDIAAVDRFGNASVFLQTAAQTFPTTPSTTFSVGGVPNDMQVADPAVVHTKGGFDDFAMPDLAFITQDGNLRVFLGQCEGGTTTFPCTSGAISFSGPTSVATGSNPSSLGLSDLNRDKKLDAVVSDFSTSEVFFYQGDGAGGLAPSGAPSTEQGTVGQGPNAILLADLDGDGKDDVITTNSDGSLTIFLSSDPPPTPAATPSATPTWTGTPLPTATPTASATGTTTATATGTPTATQTFTATETTTPGQISIMGKGCADIGGGSSVADAMPLLVFGALLVLRRRARA